MPKFKIVRQEKFFSAFAQVEDFFSFQVELCCVRELQLHGRVCRKILQ